VGVNWPPAYSRLKAIEHRSKPRTIEHARARVFLFDPFCSSARAYRDDGVEGRAAYDGHNQLMLDG
jgi:hypothetical protein